jgi:hypothetical protein
VKAGVGTHNFRALGDKRHVFVSNRTSNEINIFDQQKLEMVGSIPVPGGPDCMEVSEDGKTLWATLRWIKSRGGGYSIPQSHQTDSGRTLAAWCVLRKPRWR